MMIICRILTGKNLLVSVRNDFMPLFPVAIYICDFSVDILTKKFDQAKKGRAEAGLAYLGLENLLDPLTVDGWKEEEQLAMEERGDQLMIFELKMKKGSLSQILAPSICSNCCPEPMQAQICLDLAEKQKSHQIDGSLAWLSTGISSEMNSKHWFSAMVMFFNYLF